MSDRTLRSKLVRLASEFPTGSQERKALLDVVAQDRQAADPLMRHIGEMAKATDEIIRRRATSDPHVVDEVVKMVLRYKRILEAQGLRLRDPQAVAEDILYAADVNVEFDMFRLKEVVSEYL